MNDGADLKSCIQQFIEENDALENPLSLLSIDSPYIDIEDIPTSFPPAIKFSHRVLHINIHSIPDKLDKLKDMLVQLHESGVECDFILLCETFLKDSFSHLYTIPGYTIVSKNRQKLAKGGVAIYVANHISFKIREDLSLFHEGEFESIFIETTHSAHRTIVGEIYRIPNSPENLSLERFENILSRLQERDTSVIIGTDQNFDYLKIDTHENTLDLFNLFIASDLVPTITKPTRITHTSATLIDNIYVRHECRETRSGIIPFNISDHFPVYCLIGNVPNENKSKQPLTFQYRPIDLTALDNIATTLRNTDWTYLHDLDVNEAFADFTNQLKTTVATFAPIKTAKIPAKHVIREEWMSKGLMKSSRTLTKLHKKCVKKPKTDPSYTRYVDFRNLYNKLKRLAKCNFYEQRFDQCKSDLKQTWRLLRSLIGRNNDKSFTPTIFKRGDQAVSSPDEIANNFCEYFADVGPRFASAIPQSTKPYDHYLKSGYMRNSVSMFLTPTDPYEIHKIIMQLKSKKSSGHDDISTAFLKRIGPEISLPISILVNKSLSEGIVPDIHKLAKVIPIYKSKEKDSFSNYRPISLLPAISKILEKVMHVRLHNFFVQHNLLFKSQYGFREKRSTTQAVLEFITDTVESLENNCSTLGVFLDLSKAFDTINHTILLDKLYFYGIRGVVHEWIKSYLSNRSQYVSYGGQKSATKPTMCGVPQGSILGPLLFIIYTNDLPNCLNSAKSVIFADDTTVYQSSKDIKELYINMNRELDSLSDWFRANKLSLNVSKSNFMLFTNKKNSTGNNNLIKIGGITIEQTTTVKFLGMYMDENLKWYEHTRICKSKIASSIYAINKVKHMVPKSYIRTLYFTMIYPHLSYGIPLWGSTYNVHKKQLFIMQKRCIRIMAGANSRDHTDNLFNELHVLKLDDIYKIEVLKFVFKHMQDSLPTSLENLFTLNSKIYERDTRQRYDLHRRKCRTNLAIQHISCKGPQMWNALPSHIKELSRGTISNFVSRVKELMFQEYSG